MGLRCLVVDDHPLMRGAICQHLESLGDAIRTEAASSLAEAQRRMSAEPRIDLVLLDLNLPDTTATAGLDALRRRHASVPVLVMSAEQDRSVIQRCLRAGAAGFLPKSATAERLSAAVRTVRSGGVFLPPGIDAGPDQGWAARMVVQHDAPAASHPLGLTDRQSDVLRLILRGLPNKLIGRQLQLAEGTVKVHVSAVLRALGVRNRTQAVLAASRLGVRLPD